MIEWLEDYLSGNNITLFMVTHDRYFLDHVWDEIIELEDKQIFALRPGDSTTMMNSYGTVDEPDSDSLSASLKRYYYSHTKEQFLEKVKNFKLENTWENVIVKYENALQKIIKKEGTQRG